MQTEEKKILGKMEDLLGGIRDALDITPVVKKQENGKRFVTAENGDDIMLLDIKACSIGNNTMSKGMHSWRIMIVTYSEARRVIKRGTVDECCKAVMEIEVGMKMEGKGND